MTGPATEPPEETPGSTQRQPVIDKEAGPEAPLLAAPVRRFWSPRRIPSALTALAVLVAAGALLYDVVAVRAGHPATAWRKRLAHELATRPLDDPWVIAGAAAAAVLGLWLLVLALTPGLRSVLPMRRDTVSLRAGLDRHAAELALRDRAMEVSGVRSARVRVSRRKAVVRAEAHFRDPDEVRTELDMVLADGVADLGLAHPPALAVQVRRPQKG
jgi:hypothetical protein